MTGVFIGSIYASAGEGVTTGAELNSPAAEVISHGRDHWVIGLEYAQNQVPRPPTDLFASFVVIFVVMLQGSSPSTTSFRTCVTPDGRPALHTTCHCHPPKSPPQLGSLGRIQQANCSGLHHVPHRVGIGSARWLPAPTDPIRISHSSVD